jgi:hypothetical protein
MRNSCGDEPDPGDDQWFGGIAVGRDVRPGWEVVAEVHVNASGRDPRRRVRGQGVTSDGRADV